MRNSRDAKEFTTLFFAPTAELPQQHISKHEGTVETIVQIRGKETAHED